MISGSALDVLVSGFAASLPSAAEDSIGAVNSVASAILERLITGSSRMLHKRLFSMRGRFALPQIDQA